LNHQYSRSKLQFICDLDEANISNSAFSTNTSTAIHDDHYVAFTPSAFTIPIAVRHQFLRACVRMRARWAKLQQRRYLASHQLRPMHGNSDEEKHSEVFSSYIFSSAFIAPADRKRLIHDFQDIGDLHGNHSDNSKKAEMGSEADAARFADLDRSWRMQTTARLSPGNPSLILSTDCSLISEGHSQTG
jgi:hypothetical protein